MTSKGGGAGQELFAPPSFVFVFYMSMLSPRKTSTSASWTMLKPLTVWITTNCGKFLETGIPDRLTSLLRHLCTGQEATVRTGHGTTDGSKLGKEYIKTGYCHPAYLTYMQSMS